ncbi:MAG: cyclopropane-fatty-acyl-phospholipid synthase family protein [Proteobacteria bacterium]|nr:cyclopropane-fatty-acyl-phospholipid synthase family protein [Pseudomonadota bacterium]
MMLEALIGQAERLPLPDVVTRAGVDFLVARTRRKLERQGDALERAFALDMARFPIAQHTAEANAQHYEVPSAFFEQVLGARRKYSCCLFPKGSETLDQAEVIALEETAVHAGLADGQSILELGCGWGSLSLFMAERFPKARITSVSNSATQRATIEALAAARGLTNLTVITADMNSFEPQGAYDRIVSVEMFEHMANWQALLTRCRGWLKPEGRLFLHVFTHAHASYRFDHADKADWIAQHFFTGGIMPSRQLAHQFGDLFGVEQEWHWSGAHYARTARLWLENFDARIEAVMPILEETYGDQAALWKRRWRLFFLATEGLFGHANGEVWGVGHYRLAPTRAG